MTLLSSLTTKNICSSFQKVKKKILENVVYIFFFCYFNTTSFIFHI